MAIVVVVSVIVFVHVVFVDAFKLPSINAGLIKPRHLQLVGVKLV